MIRIIGARLSKISKESKSTKDAKAKTVVSYFSSFGTAAFDDDDDNNRCVPFFPGLFIQLDDSSSGEKLQIDVFLEATCQTLLFSLSLSDDGSKLIGPLGFEEIYDSSNSGIAVAVVDTTTISDDGLCHEVNGSGNFFMGDAVHRILNHYIDADCATLHHYMFKVPGGYCLNDLSTTLCLTASQPYVEARI